MDNIEKSTKGYDKSKKEIITKEIRKGDLTHRLTVEKVIGGYIITECTYGSPGEGKDYIDKESKMISTKNPFEEKEEEKEEESSLFGFLDEYTMDY